MQQQRLEKLLKRKASEHNYRAIGDRYGPPSIHVIYEGKPCLSFCSNDYLGLANHPRVVNAFKQAIDTYGVGSSGSFLVNGTCKAHTALQEALADFMQCPRALLFSNGYMANLGVISVLSKRTDYILYDRHCHASLLDGVRLTKAKTTRYQHNDAASLNNALAAIPCSEEKAKLVITNGVFSTTGVIASLPDVVSVADSHHAWVMVDDTHGLGYLGQHGRGSLEYTAVATDKVNVVMSSFGKAFGTYGAFVAGNEALVEALTQTANTRIFTTALPPAIAAATHESLRIIQAESERRERLHARINYFKQYAQSLALPFLTSITAIQSLLIGSSTAASKISDTLIEQGWLVKSLRPPTVPKGKAVLRLSLSSEHTEPQIKQVLTAIKLLYNMKDSYAT